VKAEKKGEEMMPWERKTFWEPLTRAFGRELTLLRSQESY